MRLLINAISIKEGGSLIVLKELIKRFRKLSVNSIIYIVINSKVEKHFTSDININFISYKNIDILPFGIFIYYEFFIRYLIQKYSIDVLFSITNYLPIIRLKCSTLLLQQHAGHFSDEFNYLIKKQMRYKHQKLIWDLKTMWVKRSINIADMVTVQTNTLKNKIINKCNIDKKKIHVIPHGNGLIRKISKGKIWTKKKDWTLGFISLYGVQKNFNVLIQAVDLLIKDGYSIKLILTLKKNNYSAVKIISEIEKSNISYIIENHESLQEKDIINLYKKIDIFVFPSFVESFGFPIVESMANAIPLLISNSSSNLEVSGSAGIIFEKNNPFQLASKVKKLIDHKEYYEKASYLSKERAKYFSWDKAAEKVLELIFKTNQLKTYEEIKPL